MKKTALIVVDMVKAFFDPEGSSYYQESSDVLENVSLLMKVARQNKVFIIHAVERRENHLGKIFWKLCAGFCLVLGFCGQITHCLSGRAGPRGWIARYSG